MIAVIGISLVGIVTSCNKTGKKCQGEETQEIKIEGGELLTDRFISINNILLNNNRLWVYSEEDPTTILHVIDKKGNLNAKGIGIGQGNNEVLELTSIHQSDDKTILFDGKAGRLYSLIVNDSTISTETLIADMGMLDDALLLNGNNILKLPVNSNISYKIEDRNGNTLDSLSYFPPKPEGVSDETHHLACTGTIAFSPNDSSFVRALAYDGGLDFFKIKSGKLSHETRYSIFDMDYGVLNLQVDVPYPSENSKTGYSRVYATPKYYYATFSDSFINDNPEGCANEIHVFDHSGKILYKLLIDKPFTAFAVAQDDNMLYTSSEDNDNSSIYAYKLNLNSD